CNANPKSGLKSIQSSSIPVGDLTREKGAPEGALSCATGLRLAAAGTRQELRVQVGAVDRRAAAPRVHGGSAHIGLGQHVGGVLHRSQRDDRVVDVGTRRKALDGDLDQAVLRGVDALDVLRSTRSAGGDFAAPVVGGLGGAVAALVDFSHRGTARAGREDHFRDLRAVAVVLVRGKRNRGQNADDRDNDHQLDQGNALVERSHLLTPKRYALVFGGGV